MKKGIKRFSIMLIACFLLSLGFGACSAQSPTDSAEISNSTETSKEVYYESQIRFYVNPENPTMSADGSGLNTSGSEYGVYGAYGEHVMDNMIKLLNEDAFAEEMLLRSQDTDGLSDDEKALYKYLPMKEVWTSEKETELSKSLNEAIDEAIPDIEAFIAAGEEVARAYEPYMIALVDYNHAQAELSSIWFDVYGTNYTLSKYQYLTDEDKAKEGFADVQAALIKTETERETVTRKSNELDTAMFFLEQAQNNAKSSRIKVFNLWCQTAKYKTFLARYSESTHFSFLLSSENIEDTNKFARSFIYADISVKEEDGYGFAVEVYEILKELVPEYVEANMAIPSGYTGTNCQRISRSDTPQRVEK